MANIAERIKECRKERGMSADELGRIVGKDRSMIFRYEKGEIENMPLNVIKAIAFALDVNPAYLMGWSDDKTSFRNSETPIAQMDDEHAELIERYDALDQARKDQLMSFLRFLESGTGR